MENFTCEAFGSIHQGNRSVFPVGYNKQCVAISACALAWKSLDMHFSTEIIDAILYAGDSLYCSLRNGRNGRQHIFLESEELSGLSVNILGRTIQFVEVLNVHNALWPRTSDDLEESLRTLEYALRNLVRDELNVGYQFTGLEVSVTFWCKRGQLFLFDSHAVNERRQNDSINDENNRARIFRCDDYHSLAQLLLMNAPLDGLDRQYSIACLKFESLTNRPSQHTLNIISQNERTSITCDSNMPESIESNSEISITKTPVIENKRGRPKKVKRGRPKYLETTREEQIAAAKKKYKKANPEIQQEDKNKYKKAHPEVQQDAIKKYKKANPEIQQEAKDKYKKAHPEIQSESEKRYKKANPDIAKNTSKTHSENNPEKNNEYIRRFRVKNPEESRMRHISLKMRRLIKSDGPVAYWNEELLVQVESYRLKIPHLTATDIYKCSHCSAALFEEEKDRKKWCCGEGKYNVLELPPLTAPFYNDKEFQKRARAYNDLFALCALGITGGYRHPSGLSFFKIEGRMYHQVYNLNAQGQKFTTRSGIAQFVNRSRLYIDDGEERRQIAEGRSLKRDLIDQISQYLYAKNPYINYFKILGQQMSIHARLEFEITNRSTHGPRLGDRQTGVEVHAVLCTEETVGDSRKLTVWKEGDQRPMTMDLFSPLMEPFQYPLIYPEGTLGWHVDRLDNSGQKLSQLDYCKCLILSEPRFRSLGRLSQAWYTEMYARKSEERLRYCLHAQTRNNEDSLRIGSFTEVENQMIRDIAADETVQGEGGVQAGKIYLPSTFTGGPRYMKVHYENAMALVSSKGCPTYFVTFTYSAQWVEHKASCINGFIDPSLACRIFQIKLLELLRDLRNGVFFGTTAYIVYIIEMQMRGLPHAHIVFKIEGEGPIQADEIDSVIWATVPSPEIAGGRLRKLVLQHMIHGPCGSDYRTDFLCWDSAKGCCSKFYPKPQETTTHADDNGFVLYRRNYDNKGEIKSRNKMIQVHDGWVVPYNPALLLKYEAHINVEIASTRRVIKYLFKYLMKGGSLQNVTIIPLHKQLNEIEHYATKRMIGASDACWNLLEFEISRSTPTVECLPIHLQGKHSVIFRPGHATEAIGRSSSKLLIYFQRPIDPIFDNLTYRGFYENCILHTKRPSTKVTVYDHADGVHYITFRQRNEKVCRILWVSPNRGELFYLRLLLLTVSCRGYDDLLRKRTPPCVTFQEVARYLGLTNDEREYDQALREASAFMVGPRLRSFFVLLCNMGAPAALLWADFRNVLCEDHLERHPHDHELAFKLSLLEIDRALRKQGSCLTDQGLPFVEDDTTEVGRELLAYGENMQKKIVAEWLPKLSPDQRQVFDHIEALTSNNTDNRQLSKVIFIDGPGGYGKTQLIKIILAQVRGRNQVAIAVASSGIAAVNIPGASTAHSTFRIPLDLGQGTSVWNVTNRSQRADLIRAARIIIFDEAPMAHRYVFELIDRSLRDLMNSVEPFGGKIFICCGDFRQIAPVVPRARTPQDSVCISLQASRLWQFFKIFHLTTPQRSKGNPAFLDFLLKIGNGTSPAFPLADKREGELLVPLPGIRFVTTLDELIEQVYPSNILRDSNVAATRAILAPLNANVKEINNLILNSLNERVHELYSTDSVDKENDDELDVDIQILNQATGKGVPDHVLRLKIGTVCLIMRNLNICDGLVNGTKVIITAISRRLITVRKPGQTQLYGIPRIIFKFNLIEGSPLIVSRRQFPIILAYSMTGHKSQGQTLDYVGIDLRTDCFAHGQLYVLLSRARQPEDVVVLVPPERVQGVQAYVKNIVYQDLLL